MKITGDYHTHTLYSHGKGTIEDSVKSAIEKGLKTLAISEHGPGHILFGVNRTKLKALKAEIISLRVKYPELHLKFGLEANILNVDGDLDVDDALISELDFLMAGYHFGSMPRANHILRDLYFHLSNLLVKWLPMLKKGCVKRNTQATVNAINRYPLFAITHPGAKGPLDIHQVAKAAFLKGTLLEINSHHGHLTVDHITLAKSHQVKFIINSDAHQPDHIGCCEEGVKRALAAGLTAEDVFNADIVDDFTKGINE